MPTKQTATRIAVVTGAHSYDVIGLRHLFSGMPGIDAYIQSLDDYSSSSDEVRESYACVVFYNFHQETPDDASCTWYMGPQRTTLEALVANEQGIVFLHHGLLAFPEWAVWSGLTGIQKRSFSFKPDQEVNLTLTEREHPITADMNPFTIIDEVYGMQEPSADSKVLLTTEHPDSMRSIAWVKEQEHKRIFCFACGHDAQAWTNPDFQEILLRGILWTAKTLH